jgi:hypothetical protein
MRRIPCGCLVVLWLVVAPRPVSAQVLMVTQTKEIAATSPRETMSSSPEEAVSRLRLAPRSRPLSFAERAAAWLRSSVAQSPTTSSKRCGTNCKMSVIVGLVGIGLGAGVLASVRDPEALAFDHPCAESLNMCRATGYLAIGAGTAGLIYGLTGGRE